SRCPPARRTPGGRGDSATVRCAGTCLSRSDARCSRRRGTCTVHMVDADTRSGYISPVLASSVSGWSSSGREWTKRYRADASFSTLLFSRTTALSHVKKPKITLLKSSANEWVALTCDCRCVVAHGLTVKETIATLKSS